MFAVVWAQAAEPQSPLQSMLPMLTMGVPLLLLWMFLIERPRRREMMTRESMIRAIKKNDRVLTSSGIYGVVTNVQADANEVTIRVDDTSNTRLRMTLSSIARVLGDDETNVQENTK